MEYLINDVKYNWSYEELSEKYKEILLLSDTQFIHKLPEILHFTVFACFIKEIPTYLCLSDNGIVHELVHLLHHGDGDLISLKDIRKQFRKQCRF